MIPGFCQLTQSWALEDLTRTSGLPLAIDSESARSKMQAITFAGTCMSAPVSALLTMPSSTSVPATPETGKRPYKCDLVTDDGRVCGRRFKTYRGLERHQDTLGHSANVYPMSPLGGYSRLAVCLIHGRAFHGRGDSLLRHLKSRSHNENELREFYKARSGEGAWTGPRGKLHTAVKNLMRQLAPHWPPAEEGDGVDDDDTDFDI